MNRFKVSGWLLVCAVILGGSVISCSADDAGRKLGRGLSNTLFGIAEIPIQVHQTVEREGNCAGATYGVVKGVGHFFMREGVGIYEIISFPIPYPRYYEPIIEPEFLFSDMQ